EPLENATEPLENATEPLENATEPLENATEPLENATEPLKNAAEPLESSFQPMLQVDQFTWSKTCLQLAESAGGELDRLAESFVAAMSAGRKVLAVGSCRRGQGATTMLLCVGKRLADWGLKSVLVDADLVDPQLARQLGILPEFGLEHVLAGQMPLQEVVIESATDRLALLPIHEPFTNSEVPADDRMRLAESFDTLTANYNLVLIDPGPLQGPRAIDGPLADVLIDRLDAVMLVYNAGVASQQRLANVQRSLTENGIAQAGIIENFVRI
ncbi:MAG: hypothetical protein HQ567_21545, partial [Candidatus Nealsonbacteria bacterium]|nr:hypothetical protein [Candidatus Nealsonbacteria bacterium]